MKIANVAVNDFKKEKFLEAFKENGYEVEAVSSLPIPETSLIKVKYKEGDKEHLHAVVAGVQQYFVDLKIKNN